MSYMPTDRKCRKPNKIRGFVMPIILTENQLELVLAQGREIDRIIRENEEKSGLWPVIIGLRKGASKVERLGPQHNPFLYSVTITLYQNEYYEMEHLLSYYTTKSGTKKSGAPLTRYRSGGELPRHPWAMSPGIGAGKKKAECCAGKSSDQRTSERPLRFSPGRSAQGRSR